MVQLLFGLLGGLCGQAYVQGVLAALLIWLPGLNTIVGEQDFGLASTLWH